MRLVYCRTKWDDGKKGNVAVGDESNGEEGYMNLGKMIGASAVRGIIYLIVLHTNVVDTSTYHYQPYRPWGKRWR